MHLISSRLTFAIKSVLPVLLLGFLAFSLIFAGTGRRNDLSFAFLAIAVISAVAIVLWMKRAFAFADQVWDAGTELVIKNGKTEVHVPLTEIMKISYSPYPPQEVTLALQRPTLLGKDITFILPNPYPLFPYLSKNPIAEELTRRVDASRRR